MKRLRFRARSGLRDVALPPGDTLPECHPSLLDPRYDSCSPDALSDDDGLSPDVGSSLGKSVALGGSGDGAGASSSSPPASSASSASSSSGVSITTDACEAASRATFGVGALGGALAGLLVGGLVGWMVTR